MSSRQDFAEEIMFMELYLDNQKIPGNIAETLDSILEGWLEWWNGKELDRMEVEGLHFNPIYLGETIEEYFTARNLELPPNELPPKIKP